MKHQEVILGLMELHKLKSIIEIGVGRAETPVYLLKNNKDIVYYGIDPWEVYDDYNNDLNSVFSRVHRNKAQADKSLQFFGNDGPVRRSRCTIIQRLSLDAVVKFFDETIGLVFIDGNHAYEYVKKDIELYWPKVHQGGIMAFHDYEDKAFPGVKRAVDECLVNYMQSQYKERLLEQEYGVRYVIK